ncbi:conserved Plasmodium protein, unknown function [Plasmodium relictum]|uniref:WW domain-containing protein n=1 Tax=Plasmodium relictum TaxID=85471 RepID=A0A1J1H4Z8_PLARL|nr:conserved Plasmodium protein, unknown function [Plasmodium relictum]CRG99982.1 conserved Plasmodium protein, unknown function [Plasmodium relictum]
MENEIEKEINEEKIVSEIVNQNKNYNNIIDINRSKYDNLSKEEQEYYVGKPYSWEYIENSKNWFIIETSKNYKFYFNKKTNEKTWNCPLELDEILKKEKKEEKIDNEEEIENINNNNLKISEESENMKNILKEYKDLLIEKNLNEFSKYESVLANILYDRRFLSVPKEMRKEYFYKLIKEVQEDKKNELKTLIENFQNLLNKKEEEFFYPFREKDAIKFLKDRNEYKGNCSEYWMNTRNKILKNFLEKKKKEKEKKVEKKFEDTLNDYLRDENPRIWIKIKNNLIKKKKYEILSYDKKDRIFESVSQKLLKKIKDRNKGRENKHSDLKHKEHSKKDKINRNEKNIFLGILSEKLKFPIINDDILKYDTCISKKENFEQICSIPDNITINEEYKKLSLSDNEKFDLYREFINNYINIKLKTFDKYLANLSVNFINNSFDEIIKLIDKDNKIFSSLKYEHLEKVYLKWKCYKIKEAKQIFKDYLKKSNFIKHNSDEKENYKKLIDTLSLDISYQRLECVSEERENIIKERIRELKIEHEKNKNLVERLNFS